MLGFLCRGIVAVHLPPGAVAYDNGVGWTPDASQANRNFKFVIKTRPDFRDDAFQVNEHRLIRKHERAFR